MNRAFMPVAFAALVSVISGCSTSKDEMLPAGDSNMLELWQGKGASGSAQRGAQGREALRRLLSETEDQRADKLDYSYSRTQESEITQQFPRLPNPDMVMYVFPHLAGGNSPVPGYSTVFPFYSRCSTPCRVSARRICNDVFPV